MPSFWNAQVMSKDWLSIIDDTIGWAHAGSDTLQIVLDGLIANWHSDITSFFIQSHSFVKLELAYFFLSLK